MLYYSLCHLGQRYNHNISPKHFWLEIIGKWWNCYRKMCQNRPWFSFIHEDLCNGFCRCLVLGHRQPKLVARQQEEAGHHGDLSPRKEDHRQSYHPACAVEHLHQLVSFRVVSEVQSGCEPFADVSFFSLGGRLPRFDPTAYPFSH